MSSPAHARSNDRHGGSPVRTAAIIIYATFALLMLTIPQSLVNWLRDMDENPVQQTLLRGAEAGQAVSRRAGLDAPYRRMRAEFYALTGKEDN